MVGETNVISLYPSTLYGTFPVVQIEALILSAVAYHPPERYNTISQIPQASTTNNKVGPLAPLEKKSFHDLGLRREKIFLSTSEYRTVWLSDEIDFARNVTDHAPDAPVGKRAKGEGGWEPLIQPGTEQMEGFLLSTNEEIGKPQFGRSAERRQKKVATKGLNDVLCAAHPHS
ncbi:MAG: hypothetical protein M1827_006641 [Pycnora praestabilis]|nr:MAG: hypothetical protein M1827_006641 [Pycnora praestabilis]